MGKGTFNNVFGGSRNHEKFSPLSYFTKSAPAILTIHGTLDDTIPYSQALGFDTRAKALRIKHELVTCKDEKHGFTFENRQKAKDHMVYFFFKNP
jgi:dipeptidyl aminopeptidase/acylaminoacyl peptidase